MFSAEYKLVIYRGLKLVHSEAPFYRLNDMLSVGGKRYESCNDDGLNPNPHCNENENWEQYHIRNFPNSIVVKFLQKSEEKKANIIPTLWSILKDTKSTLKLPDPKTIVMHLRVGDVIDKTSICHGSEFWDNRINTWQASGKGSSPSWANYTITKHDFESFALPSDATQISIVYGFHTNDDHKKSMEYIQSVEDYLKKRNFRVIFETHETADDALRFMSHAKCFIPSGGGFSRLCSRMVTHYGGKVINIA